MTHLPPIWTAFGQIPLPSYWSGKFYYITRLCIIIWSPSVLLLSCPVSFFVWTSFRHRPPLLFGTHDLWSIIHYIFSALLLSGNFGRIGFQEYFWHYSICRFAYQCSSHNLCWGLFCYTWMQILCPILSSDILDYLTHVGLIIWSPSIVLHIKNLSFSSRVSLLNWASLRHWPSSLIGMHHWVAISS